MDICFIEHAAPQDEVCLRENDHFVGATAAFSTDWEIIPLRSDRIPKRYALLNSMSVTNRIDPDFESHKDTLAKVARCTCFIGAMYSSDDFPSGTEFFVSLTTLLMVGHIAKDKTTSIVAQLPGMQNSDD